MEYNFDIDLKTKEDVSNISDIDFNNAIILLENNRILFSPEALKALNASPGDRISINYYTVDEQCTFPVIGKSAAFTDSTGGNKLTKSKTISFRGRQGETLSRYGKNFKMEPFNNYFKMIPFEIEENDDLTEEELDLLNI